MVSEISICGKSILRNFLAMRYLNFIVLAILVPLILEGARIKDLTDVKGSRSNQLFGYGIVTGLAGQGDSKIEYTELGILNALETRDPCGQSG